MSGASNNSRRPLPPPPLRAAQKPGDALWDDKHWHPGPGEATIRLRSNTLKPQLTLYSNWFCPFAQRTWIVCEEIGVKYLWREINPYQVDPSQAGGYTKISLSLEEKRRLYPDFIEASPRGLVPAVAHHHHSKENSSGKKKKLDVWESLPAAEYVDAVFGNGSLMPSDPWERAMTQIWCDHCTHRIQKSTTPHSWPKMWHQVADIWSSALWNAVHWRGPCSATVKVAHFSGAIASLWSMSPWHPFGNA